MKNSSKFILIAAFLFFVSGIGLFLSGLFMGGNRNIMEIINTGLFSIRFVGNNVAVPIPPGGGLTAIGRTPQLPQLPELRDNFSTAIIGNTGDRLYYDDLNGINNIIMNIDRGRVRVQAGNKFSLEVLNANLDFITVEAGNGTLIVNENLPNRIVHSNIQTEFILNIPEGAQINSTEITTGMGSIDINGIYAGDLFLNAGMGSISINNVTGNKFTADAGMGNISAGRVNFNYVWLDCGMGSVNFNGLVNGDIIINCGMGNITVNLENNPADFRYQLSGRVRINNQRPEQFEYINNENESAYLLNVEAGMGSVTINFR